jgi:quinol monooxygenase YgiN
MLTHSTCALYLHYVVKEGKEAELLGHLEQVLDECAKEADFITAVLHRTPERPGEFTLYELWRGTREEFAVTQGVRPYRKEYLAATKPLVENVQVTWDTPIRVWGAFAPPIA